jgi:hypothetical protein
LFTSCDNGTTNDNEYKNTYPHAGMWKYDDGTITSILYIDVQGFFTWQYTNTSQSISYNLNGVYEYNSLFGHITFYFSFQSAGTIDRSSFSSVYKIENGELHILSIENKELIHSKLQQ